MNVQLENRNLPEQSFAILKSALRTRLGRRGVAFDGKGTADLILSVGLTGEKDGADRFTIMREGDRVLFGANDLCTVFAAVGYFLRKAKYDYKGGFVAPALPIAHTMKNSLRGMYFASHFYNFYHAAPIEEVYEIIIDQALNGCNLLMLCFGVQHYTGTDTPEAQEMIARMKLMLKFADLVGIAPALILFSNTGFDQSPPELKAQAKIDESGRYYHDLVAVFNTEICPSKPGGMAEIERQQRQFFAAFADTPIRYFALWPYDEGGCLCEKCYPWATNGFMRVADLSRRLIKEYGYHAEIIISTWPFDFNMHGDYELFFNEVRKGTYSWSPYVMTSFRSGRIPKYLLDDPLPKDVHLIDFPEISMLNAKPWGGFGANPDVMFLDNVYQNCGALHDGGFPYSEGIFDDINKWVCLGFYTGYYEHSADAVRDYIRYEYGLDDTDDLLRAIQLSEPGLARTTERTDPMRFAIRWGTAIPEIYRIVCETEPKLPEQVRSYWRWRILYLRGVIDYELYRNDYVTKNSEVAQKAYRELHEIFHTQKALFEVCPPEGK